MECVNSVLKGNFLLSNYILPAVDDKVAFHL